MTAVPAGFPGEPGTLWVASVDGALHITTSGGLLRRVGDDDPNGARPAGLVWAEVGPLVPAPALAAAYRQSAHEMVCRLDGGCPVHADHVSGDADRLYKRAEQVSPS